MAATSRRPSTTLNRAAERLFIREQPPININFIHCGPGRRSYADGKDVEVVIPTRVLPLAGPVTWQNKIRL